MTRFWAITVLALMTSVGLTQDNGVKKEKVFDKDFEIKGKFSDDDPRDQQRGGPAQTRLVKMKAGQRYTIDMISSELDSYLRLLDSNGKQLDEDDDSGGMLNSRIIFNCPKDGEYKVVCTTFAAGMSGNYVLAVKSNTSPKTLSAHAQLLGKEAPNFKADFAVNGAPLQLSDLKGKVVLLGFCEVRSSASAAVLPQLAEWHKAHKADGLAIALVTFYTSDIGQKLAFDKESGKITDLKQADHKTDQTMIGNYASHHKIDHLLMVLTKEEALNAYDAYSVNSLPQIVLIDRTGKVHRVQVGGVKGSDLENDIKKLLAEK